MFYDTLQIFYTSGSAWQDSLTSGKVHVRYRLTPQQRHTQLSRQESCKVCVGNATYKITKLCNFLMKIDNAINSIHIFTPNRPDASQKMKETKKGKRWLNEVTFMLIKLQVPILTTPRCKELQMSKEYRNYALKTLKPASKSLKIGTFFFFFSYNFETTIDLTRQRRPTKGSKSVNMKIFYTHLL